ncbi:MAG: FtsQ-type POTRA domain-containing protein [Candidatus Atribacteria bacterium]|nr:FtsQ-type POTRA domain-containing protein [Candidatus Atribacteria bacterium]
MKRTDENEEQIEEEKEFEEEQEEEEEEPQHPAVKITKILIFYLAMAFLGWNFFSFMFSSNFCSIGEIVIRGNDYLSEDEILYRAKIKLGENTFKVDLKESKNFLMQEPWVKEAEIKRVIPNKIIISIKERKVAAFVCIGDEYFASSKEGIVLSNIVKTEEEFVLPLILGLEISEIKIGEIIDKPEFKTALESINSAEVILPKKFSQVVILSSDDFMICNKDDTLKVRVNGPEEIINKENLLREALEKIKREKLSVEYIDVRFKDSLIIKVKK